MKHPNVFIKKIILFIPVFAFFYSCAQKKESESQYRTVELEIIGHQYDALFLEAFQRGGRSLIIAGETTDGYQWAFTVPDSVVQRTKSFTFISRDSIPTSFSIFRETNIRRTAFLGVIEGDTLMARQFHFDKNERKVRLKMEFLRTVRESNYQYIPELDSTVLVQGWYTEHFLIDPNQNRRIRENMITPLDFFFSYFGTERYSEYLDEFAAKIKKNPTSLYYMTNLAGTANFHESKQDVERLFRLFSDEMQRSFFGQIVYRHFETFKVDNVSLMNTDTGIEENVVMSSDKYTLVIFSASWCAPCRRAIPKLKEIHEKMSEFLEMVYITVDEEQTLSYWNELMQDENIPWRSLALGNNRELRNAWSIIGVPDYVLISPSLEARKIRLSDENDINELFLIVRK